MIELLNANALSIPLADGSVQMVATSPPYLGLRNYKVDGQLGLESLHDCLGWATGDFCGECYVCHTLAWTREVWRVLRDDGVFWLNLGDSYATSQAGNKTWGNGVGSNRHYENGDIGLPKRCIPKGIKQKDLIGIPWRCALALQADGWYLRRDVVWEKTNAMPESTRDRPTTSHEYIFMLSKSARYYWDKEAVKEAYETPLDRWGGDKKKLTDNLKGEDNPYQGAHRERNMRPDPDGRNIRSVWTVPTAPYKGAHYATWPPRIVETMIKAGSSEKGCCPVCGKPWVRVIEKGYRAPAQEDVIADMVAKGVPRQKANLYGNPTRDPKLYAENPDRTLGWRPDCACYKVEIIGAQPMPPAKKEKETQAEYERKLEEYERARAAWLARWEELNAIYVTLEVVPCVVLDPFVGSGTTLLVARQLDRSGIGLDLSFTYLKENATKRLELDKLRKWAGR